jgi:hypothetical protein
MADTRRQENGGTFLRQWTIPEEDRSKYTTQAWAGEYRWFRAPNVVCLEQYGRGAEEAALEKAEETP